MAGTGQVLLRAVCSPWDEARWDKFIREKDVRVEECVRLLEIYAGHPDREEKALRSMGLYLRPKKEELFPETVAGEELLPDEGEQEVPSEESGALDESGRGERWQLVRENPAYVAAHQFCQEIHQHLPESGTRSTQPLIELMSQAYCVCAKLAGGLGGGNLGEDPAMVIAYCKRALKSVQRCLEALRIIEDSDILPAEEVACLRHMALEVREEIITQVSGFRSLDRARARGV